MRRFQRLGDVRLRGNPLHCDCRLGWLYDWLQLSLPDYHRALVEWRCASPGSLAGHLFGSLSLGELECLETEGNHTHVLHACQRDEDDDDDDEMKNVYDGLNSNEVSMKPL